MLKKIEHLSVGVSATPDRCVYVLSGLSERAGGGGGGGSRTEDTWLFTREEKKWAEKC